MAKFPKKSYHLLHMFIYIKDYKICVIAIYITLVWAAANQY